ncbi:MAG: metal-dependent hydrolase [Deltaproteobacteria bacterium]|nr:metal-dependent hydrolase [Deltaproteobacteria bacterium]
MDNLTHSLVGLAIGEASYQLQISRREADSFRRRLLWVSSLIASNLPDADSLWVPLLGGGKLRYLLQHRGYSHTLIGVVPQLLVVMFLIWLFLKLTKRKLLLGDWYIVGLTGVIGLVVHIFLDFVGSYGVHPFWPWSGRWVYGDAIFIVEPFVWCSLLPWLFFSTRKIGKWLIGALQLAAIGLCVYSGIVPGLMVGVLIVWASGLWLTSVFLMDKQRIMLALGVCVSVFVVFFYIHQVVYRYTTAKAYSLFPKAELHDVILSPLPANPLCWQLILVQTEGSAYLMRKGFVAPMPAVLEASSCVALWSTQASSILRPMDQMENPHMKWVGEFRGSVMDFRRIAKLREPSLFLRFSRAPFWISLGNNVVLGDLRFHRGSTQGFSVVEVETEPASFPAEGPNWIPPRSDILKE